MSTFPRNSGKSLIAVTRETLKAFHGEGSSGDAQFW
jgi:hypothetical protein